VNKGNEWKQKVNWVLSAVLGMVSGLLSKGSEPFLQLMATIRICRHSGRVASSENNFIRMEYLSLVSNQSLQQGRLQSVSECDLRSTVKMVSFFVFFFLNLKSIQRK